jgi:uncharacterized protein YqgQ
MKTSINRIRILMNKPFPFYETYKQKLGIPIVMSLFVMIGIIVLNTSKDSNLSNEQILNVSVYGLVTILITIVFSTILPEILPDTFNIEKWNVKKTIIFFLSNIFSVGILLSLIAYYYDNPNNLLFSHFFYLILFRAIALSFFPIIVIVLFAERVLNKKNHLQALEIINQIKSKPKKINMNNQIAYTFAKNTIDEIHLAESDIFYIKAEGNYCLIVYMKKSVFIKQLIRSKLKEIEQIVEKTNSLIRCHRSYIVNLEKVSDITGNAKGYTLHLGKHNYKIPVSRKLSKTIISRIQHN